jgi:hypothetical protein
VRINHCGDRHPIEVTIEGSAAPAEEVWDWWDPLNPRGLLSILSRSQTKKKERAVHVKSRQEIKREYKEREKPAGIFQVKNIANGKVLLGSSLNLEGPLNSQKFMLTIGQHRNEELQKDWDKFGPENFLFEILEVVKITNDPGFNLNDELTLLEQIWIEKLQPFGERGYNQDTNIRQA